MRKWLTIACALVAVLVVGTAAAQETRGTISGTVRDKCVVFTSLRLCVSDQMKGLPLRRASGLA